MTEDEVVRIINKIVNRLAYKFKFGYHDIDDMKQQGRLLAIEALASDKYDGKRPLENFLWTHVHNRLFNFKRDNFERPDTPCDTCDKIKEDVCTKYKNINECPLYMNWIKRNEAKKNLMKPIELSGVDDENETSMKKIDDITNTLIHKEIVDLIDKQLPIILRRDWLLCCKDVRIPKAHKLKLQEAILHILKENGIDVQETWQIA